MYFVLDFSDKLKKKTKQKQKRTTAPHPFQLGVNDCAMFFARGLINVHTDQRLCTYFIA